MKSGKRGWGDIGEEYAIKFLQSKGYKIIERNFRCRLGEIDIIANDSDTLVFVEVKTRWSKKYGLPEKSVTTRKLYKIKRVAEYYIMKNQNITKKKRIDVVAIEVENGKVTRAKIIKVI